jgi:DNA-binding response OmpR family regulator
MKEEQKHIFVVDDDPDSREVISDSIGDEFGIIHECKSGVEALKMIAHGGLPDVMLIDYMMPGMSGLELCEQVRGMAGGVLVPIIMITARDSLEDLVLGLEKGADDYLTKPFQYEELRARVRALLRVRDLNLRLQRAHDEVVGLQDQLIQAERRALVGELAGAAAHELGQPLSAILLNIFLVDKLGSNSPKGASALKALQQDAEKMKTLVEQLRTIDPNNASAYYQARKILSLTSVDDTDSESGKEI